LIERASDPVVVLDAQRIIRFASPAFETALGRNPAQVTGTPLTDYVHPDDVEAVHAALSEVGLPGSYHPVAGRLQHGDGTWRHTELVFTALGGDPAVGEVVANLHDVTDRDEAEKALAYQAFHDNLTDLPNRMLFTDRVEQTLHRATRLGHATSVVFLDLDNFKDVNDHLGHGVGDALLREVAARLASATRAEDTLARLGGDEFAVLIDHHQPVVLEQIADRLLAALELPIDLFDYRIRVRASAGLATVDKTGSLDELIRQADIAMYAAKAAGRHGWERYQPGSQRARLERWVGSAPDITLIRTKPDEKERFIGASRK
jgi:diguanylate cyclase (GGDEF)-like protein/PAS domain S-box-containing protein